MSGSILNDFAKEVARLRDSGETLEGPYRSQIEALFQNLSFDGHEIRAINEGGRVESHDESNAKSMRPDFFVKRDGNVIGYVEHKKIEVNIRSMSGENEKQKARYTAALPNLIYTNCIEWDFYRDGRLDVSITLGTEDENLEMRLKEFLDHNPEPISSPKILASKMARKTTILKILLQEKLENGDRNDEIHDHYEEFSNSIMRDESKDDFAKFYAETITYGLFSSRMNVCKEKEFTRESASKSIPKNNPFLRRLFRYIFDGDLDQNIDWIIDELVSLLSVCDINGLMTGFLKNDGKDDPFVHFYETFLEAYDPDRRKKRGVYYTPRQAVSFVVRAVDHVLKNEMKVKEGLADHSTIRDKLDEDGKPVHKVRVLDPATGTGTFLVETIRQVEPTIRRYADSDTIWTQYVEENLIPRLHGFEILMAPYAMCFAKIDMVLRSLGYDPSENPGRLEVYLNDALDLGRSGEFKMTRFLTKEADLAGLIKDGNKPVMCVIGNPPYNANVPAPDEKSKICSLLEVYKKEPEKECKLEGDSNTKQLNDLYLRFMRLSSYLVEESGEGVIGVITKNKYLYASTFRGVRYHLQRTFDKIWILNLRAIQKDKIPNGTRDESIFQGVNAGIAIIIGMKTKNANDETNRLAEVRYADVYGTKKLKLEKLENMTLFDPEFKVVESLSPSFFMFDIDISNIDAYNAGFPMDEMMPQPKARSGMATCNDNFSLHVKKEKLHQRLKKFSSLNDEDARKYIKEVTKSKKKMSRDVLDKIRKEVKNINDKMFKEVSYRPFDKRHVYYTGKDGGLIGRCRKKTMDLMQIPDNIGIAVVKNLDQPDDYHHVFCCEGILDITLISNATSGRSCVFPLMVNDGGIERNGKRYNFEPENFSRIVEMTRRLTARGKRSKEATPDDVFYYIYGVLHCPRYRLVFKNFLWQGFPRIPWPSSPDEFWSISEKGEALINLHLMSSNNVNGDTYQFTGNGDNRISDDDKTRKYDNGKIKINSYQGFENVPEDLWNFCIGNYKPAQSWLSARAGMKIKLDDIKHYRKILNNLAETQKIMQTIKMDLPEE